MKTLALFLTVIVAAGCSSGQTPPQGPETSPSAEGSTSTGGLAPIDSSSTSTGGAVSTVPTTQPTSTTTSVPTSEPVPTAALPDAARGGKLFAENNCNGCHGTKAKPGKKNVFVMKWNDDEKKKAADIIKKGKSPMPGFGDKLNDADVADLVLFVSTK
jgi:mono/diheme cytochrome c family protein